MTSNSELDYMFTNLMDDLDLLCVQSHQKSSRQGWLKNVNGKCQFDFKFPIFFFKQIITKWNMWRA